MFGSTFLTAKVLKVKGFETQKPKKGQMSESKPVFSNNNEMTDLHFNDKIKGK